MVVIIVLSLALIGVAAFLVQRLVFAHRASSYCQIYINLPDKSQSVNDGLADQSSADMAAIADSFAGLADLLIELSQAGPPAAAVSPLDQSISALETMSTAALEGSDRFAAVYLDQLPTMTDALKAVDTVSLAYCN
jgi:hypothetical protein